jgi:hypothetical protein
VRDRADQLTFVLGALDRDTGEGRRAGVRLDGVSEPMAILLCTCDHRRETHWYEKRRDAWTVCRICRCVRFTAPASEERKLTFRQD